MIMKRDSKKRMLLSNGHSTGPLSTFYLNKFNFEIPSAEPPLKNFRLCI